MYIILLSILGGILALGIGAEIIVRSSINLASIYKVSGYFIGFTVVALGTSLPELVSSIIAAKRGHGEMAIGNIFGSNIFNILLVMGTASSIKPLNIQQAIHPDLVYTTTLTFLLLLMIRQGRVIRKIDGLFLIVCYVAYIGLNGNAAL